MKQGPYFCRDKSCFKYFCHGCWDLSHGGSIRSQHKPLMRNIRGITRARNYHGMQDYSSGGGRYRGQDNMRSFSDYFSQSISLQ